MSDLVPFFVVGLASGSVYGMAGAGLVLTYRTSGIFNFAHGTVAAVMAYGFYELRQRHGLPWPVALGLCLLGGAPVLGLVLEWLVRGVGRASLVMRVVATVGLVVVGQQAVVLRYGPEAVRSEAFLPTGTFRLAGVHVGWDQLIVLLAGGLATAGLHLLLWRSGLGRSMRAVVDNEELVALAGRRPSTVRRLAWCIGSAFAALSGILLAPSVGLDVLLLTLLVVQAFGAAAIGLFRSIPLTYLGGVLIGVGGAVATRYVSSFPTLEGLPASLPFIVLFTVLVAVPRRWLQTSDEDRRATRSGAAHLGRPRARRGVASVAMLAGAFVVAWVAGTRIGVYAAAGAHAVILMSLALLVRMSGQVSLAQLAFAALGATTSARLVVDGGLPWLAAVFAGGLVAAPLGAALAVPAIRRAGLYLALATFGFAVLLERLVFTTSLMFGGASTSLLAPRPSWASNDRAYFLLVAAFVAATAAALTVIRRGRLGRLLRAMADSPVALETYGTSVTALKVTVFTVAAFLAAIGGALLGPVTGAASPSTFGSFQSLLALVVLAIVPGNEIFAALGGAGLLVVVPSYVTTATANEYLTALFGIGAIAVATSQGAAEVPRWLVRAALARRTCPERHPALARMGVGETV